MAKLAWLAVGCVVASALTLACSGTTEGGNGGGGGSTIVSEGPVAQDQLPQKYADAICNNSGPCCQKYGFPYDASKCSAGLRAELEKDLGEIAAVQGVAYDAAKAGECVAWVKKIVTQCIVNEADVEAMQKTCSAVWKGSRKEGEACTTDSQCAGADTGQVECNETFVDGGFSGTCTKPTTSQAVRGVKGSACNSTCYSSTYGSECSGGGGTGGGGPTPGPAECWIDDGLQCDDATYTCVDLVAEGQPCSWSDFCVKSAWCNSGTCTPRSPVGGECAAAMMTTACVDGAYCDEGTKKCVAQVPEGSPCTSGEQCATSRCESNKCIPRNVIVEDEICGGQVPDDDPVPGGS